MDTEEALAELGIEWPAGSKLSCPKHSDSDPSLHLYQADKGWYCFSCNTGGDGWGLLSHYLDVPVAQLMRERGHVVRPRGRSRHEQLAEYEAQAREMYAQLVETAPLWWVQQVEDRVDYLYRELDLLSARYFPEEKPPAEMAAIIKELERFYERAIGDGLELRRLVQSNGRALLVMGDSSVQGPAISQEAGTDGGRLGERPRGSVPWQSGTIRVAQT